MRHSPLLAALAGLSILSLQISAQGLPFRVPVVDWAPEAYVRQQQAFRSRPSDREVLF